MSKSLNISLKQLNKQINNILKSKWENKNKFQRYLHLWKNIYDKHQNT